MNTKLFKTENLLWVKFKRAMYALMVITIAIAIPVLSYLELSYNNSDNKKDNEEKINTVATSVIKGNTVKL